MASLFYHHAAAFSDQAVDQDQSDHGDRQISDRDGNVAVDLSWWHLEQLDESVDLFRAEDLAVGGIGKRGHHFRASPPGSVSSTDYPLNAIFFLIHMENLTKMVSEIW